MSSHRPSGHDPPTGNSGKVPGLLPKHPGDNPAQHAILRFLDDVEQKLGEVRLLHTAKTGRCAEAECIVLYDMKDLDEVPASKRKELEIRWKTSNAEKSKKMTDIVLREWSALYSHILESVKDVHIILYQKMKDECPLEKDGHPGSFDGPLAFRFLMADIQRYVSGDVKRQDKHIYEDAF